MKKTVGRGFLCHVVVIFLLLSLVSCGWERIPGEVPETLQISGSDVCKVMFLDRGEPYFTAEVRSGEPVCLPVPPQRTNYLFRTWYTDADCTEIYDFSDKVETDLTLYAGWILDAAKLTNEITGSVIRATVTVYNKCYNTKKLPGGWDTGVETESTVSQGSGVIFYHPERTDEYVLLTNCHVVCMREGYEKQEIRVVDYLGNSHTASVMRNRDNIEMISPDYDLACVRFYASGASLETVAVSRNDPAAHDDVIAIGAPKGQWNAITFGWVLGYRSITLKEVSAQQSNVRFDVICHSSDIDSGSSGGVLLDSDLQIAGINYAGNSDEETHVGLAIPASRVIEFLEEYCGFVWDA